jgi:hypothetical protein
MGRDSSVGIATRLGWTVRSSSPGAGEIFRSADLPWVPPASSTVSTRSFPGVRRPGRGVDHPLHPASKLKEEWSYSSTPLCAFRAGYMRLFTLYILLISIQPLARFWQEPKPSQATGMALARCILSKFLGLVCHCFPMLLDLPTFAVRCLHVPNNASASSSERWNCGRECCPVILPK